MLLVDSRLHQLLSNRN